MVSLPCVTIEQKWKVLGFGDKDIGKIIWGFVFYFLFIALYCLLFLYFFIISLSHTNIYSHFHPPPKKKTVQTLPHQCPLCGGPRPFS